MLVKRHLQAGDVGGVNSTTTAVCGSAASAAVGCARLRRAALAVPFPVTGMAGTLFALTIDNVLSAAPTRFPFFQADEINLSTSTHLYSLSRPSRTNARRNLCNQAHAVRYPPSFFGRKSSRTLRSCGVVLAESSGYPVSSTSQSTFKEYACIRWDVRSKY